MTNPDKENDWKRINSGVRDAGRLISQHRYNDSMVKCRQTLESMVKLLAARAYIGESGDLKSAIDALYQNGWISKTSCEHFHTIRIIGNKAVHEEYDNAYDAGQAHQLLSLEVRTFAGEPVKTFKSSGRKRSRTSSKSGFHGAPLLKLMVPVLSALLLILIIQLAKPDSSEPPAPHKIPETSAETMPVPPSSDVSASSSPETAYTTTSVLNVRQSPSTNSEILGVLSKGERIDYVRRYDEDWTVINYNGSEAYVASRYLSKSP